MIVLIDNGHGAETPGKRSPDNSILEYAYTRRMADALVDALRRDGLTARRLVTETADIPLAERIRRANSIREPAILISLHLNAAGSDGRWHDASGFSSFVAPNASERSRLLAQLLTEEAIGAGLTGNRCVPPDKVWVSNLAICRRTICPAVLTESLFQDNRDDVSRLLSPQGFRKLVSIHRNAILTYLNRQNE